MSETITCVRCKKRMAWEDAEVVEVEPGIPPYIEEDEMPVFELVCEECVAGDAQ